MLLDRGGVWSASHSIPRYGVTRYRLDYPQGIGAAKWKIAYPRAFPALVAKNTHANELPEALQLAIMREESAFSPRTESFANAIGLTQMLVKTAKRFANGAPVTRDDPARPRQERRDRRGFLGFLWKHFSGAPPLTIAGYNAGEGAVDHWLGDRGELAMDEFMETIPYDETRNYTKRVLASYFAYSWLYAGKPVPAVPLRARAETKHADHAAARRSTATTSSPRAPKRFTRPRGETSLRGNPERVPAPSREGLRSAKPSSVHAIAAYFFFLRRKKPPRSGLTRWPPAAA